MAESAELDGLSIAAIILAIVAWMGFAVAFFVADDPFLFLLIALLAGGAALILAVRARRNEAVVAAAGATAAGAALLYGLTLAAVLTAMIYASGILLLLVFLILLGVMSTPQGGSCGSSSSSSSGGGSCCDCGDCCGSACDSGCGSCCDCGCGNCCGDCAGCGCIAFGFVAAHATARPRASFRDQMARVLRSGLAHHPRTPEYDQDVYRIGPTRWCIGCFTTFPLFLVASALFVFATTPSWSAALAIGAPLVLAQGISSAGLAKRAWMKAAVKASLGIGLAFLVTGIHSAPWLPVAKLGAFSALLALAWLSAIPRGKRMRRAAKARELDTAPPATE